MNNIHMIARYKNLGIQGVCPTGKFPALQAKIGTNGWVNKVHLITHTQGQELLLHERRPLNEIIQVALALEVYREAEEEGEEEVAGEQFLWDNPHL